MSVAQLNQQMSESIFNEVAEFASFVTPDSEADHFGMVHNQPADASVAGGYIDTFASDLAPSPIEFRAAAPHEVHRPLRETFGYIAVCQRSRVY